METDNGPATRFINGWVIKERVPEGPGPHPVMLLLHGWTGDEDVMWIFARNLDLKYWIISPRGLYPAAPAGFGWQERVTKSWPAVEDFIPATGRLLDLLAPGNFLEADFGRMAGIGFSQGAALLFTLALTHPGRVALLAGLSGFLPENAQVLVAERPLRDKPIFLAHGKTDHLVPVEKARQAAEALTQAGARVSYCEEDVGHKLSASCFRSMEAFFKTNDLT